MFEFKIDDWLRHGSACGGRSPFKLPNIQPPCKRLDAAMGSKVPKVAGLDATIWKEIG
jgi:hypothetical protein